MFSLIITIVSIALVVALIAATMYYGADTLTRGQAAANAAALISGGEQVLAAMTAFQAQTGRYPNNLEELITSNYLRSFPELADAGFELISSAHAAPVDGVGDWLYDHETPHLAYVGTLDMETCAEVNSQVNGHRVVLNRIDPDPRAQCVVKGAQAPVVVFRHPGEKDFTGWDDHPRIPSPHPEGGFKAPDYAGACVFGCDGSSGSTEPEGEATGPDYGSLSCDFNYNEGGTQADISCVATVGDAALTGMRAHPINTTMEYAELNLSCDLPGGAVLSDSGGWMGGVVTLSEPAPTGSVCSFTGTLYPGTFSFSDQEGMNQVRVETRTGGAYCYTTSDGDAYCGE